MKRKKLKTKQMMLTTLALGGIAILAGCKTNKASDIVSKMTVEEKANMVVGTNRMLVMPPPPHRAWWCARSQTSRR